MLRPRSCAPAAALLASLLSAPAEAQCFEQKIPDPPPTGAHSFGTALDLDGPILVVGAIRDDTFGIDVGVAHVFEREPQGWVHVTRLHGSGFFPATVDHFGRAISVHGSEAWIGAPLDDPAGTASGAVYVFAESGGVWSQRQALVAGDAEIYALFGDALDCDGETGVVGAPYETAAGPDAGAVYVFERSGPSWVQVQRLLPGLTGGGQELGSGVAVDGARLLAGAPSPTLPSSGYVATYERAGGAWVGAGQLVPGDGNIGDRFGDAVALSGDLALVGAPYKHTGAPRSGAAYVFERQGSGWVQVGKLLDPTPHADDLFGGVVALSGRRAAVASRDNDPGVSRGAVFVFEELDGAWRLVERLTAFDAANLDFFGEGLALDDDVLVAGAPFDDSGANLSGSAYVFHLPGWARTYCLCAEDAPCGNEDPLGGCANSTGGGARLDACGSPSVAADDLELRLSGIPTGAAAGLLLGGGDEVAPFADGPRCVSARGAGSFLLRVGPQPGGGYVHWGPGLLALIETSLPPAAHVQPGSTWYVQAVYRNAAGPCGTGLNTSNALALTFAP